MKTLSYSVNSIIKLQFLFIFYVSSSFYLTAQQKVVGGVDVDIKDYPWQVAVDYGCGGSIIGDSWYNCSSLCGRWC